MPFGTMVHIRVRWTETLYNPDVKSYPFFFIPEDHLIEFPGYVYHCHFPHHEDNEMMRPYYLKPSPFFLENYSPPKGSKH